jgi:hypothetical protein
VARVFEEKDGERRGKRKNLRFMGLDSNYNNIWNEGKIQLKIFGGAPK